MRRRKDGTRCDELANFIGTCIPCGKAIFRSRKVARRTAKKMFPEEEMHAYKCQHGVGWHYGHKWAQYRT